MFAILISEENMPKIEKEAPTRPYLIESVRSYLGLSADWYFVTGYVDHKGRFKPSTVLPAYIIDENFEYDPVKIKTDWDQIVRK